MRNEVKQVFGLFGRKDPVCGMKEEKGKGLEKHGKWFCAEDCAKEYEKQEKRASMRKKGSCGCCG